MQSIIGAKGYHFTEQRASEDNLVAHIGAHQITKPSYTKLLSYKNVWYVQEMSSTSVLFKKVIWIA